MTREELNQKLQVITAAPEQSGVEMYFLVDDGEQQVIRSVDIDDNASAAIKTALVEQLEAKFIANTELRVALLSDADDRKNTVYQYDHGDLPWDLQAMKDIKANRQREEFSFQDFEIADVLAMVFVLGGNGNEIVIYKKRYSISVIQPDSTFLGYFRDDKRFVQFDKEILKVNDKFEFILVDDEIMVCSVKTLERFYGFDEIVRKEASSRMGIIRAADLIDDLASFEAMIQGKLPAAKKLVKAKRAAIILSKPAKKIYLFAQKNPKLKGKFKLSDDGKKLQLNTVEARQLFLKLLNDDYLKSELSGLVYESENKDLQEADTPPAPAGTP